MKTVRIESTTRRERTTLAKKMRVALGTLDHIASGIRQPSANMARRIEEATIALGWEAPITRESLCEACGKCDLAKAARKARGEK